jgi:NodT family efflux transporter outer membrane factor (OMF) lipoprotein
MTRHPLLILTLVATTALGGCATAYTRPSAPLPAAYPHAVVATAAPAATGEAWWSAFGDERLDRLVTQVLARNNNLAAATILVRRAQLEAGIAGNALLPQGSGQANSTVSLQDGNAQSHSVQASVSYTADLFGKLGAERDAARWEARATAQDLAATRLALEGTTLELYWTLAYLNQQIASGEASVAYARQTLTLVTAQHDAGAVSAIELNEARRNVETQVAAQSALVQQRVETRNALTLLLAGTPWPEADEPQSLSAAVLPQVDPGVPADLVGRRPDLAAAEQRLRESLSGVDAAKASFYPAITLTASGGGTSSELSKVLSDPTSSLGVGITLPFLNWHALSLNLKVSKADYERAVVLFRQSLLQAFVDVDNALSARRQLADQGRSLEASQVAARRAEQLYGVRYKAGAVDLRTWLDAQEKARAADLSAAANRQSQLLALSTLYQALGGATR